MLITWFGPKLWWSLYKYVFIFEKIGKRHKEKKWDENLLDVISRINKHFQKTDAES